MSAHPAVSCATVALVAGLVLAGCGSGDDQVAEPPAATGTVSTTAPTPSPTASSTPTPTPTASSTPTPTPSASPTRTGANRGLRSARADVRTAAPALQDYFDQREYPVDLTQLRTTLGDAGVTLAAGNSIGGYGLSGDGVQFVLCVQHDGGAWASYDTAAGRVDESGATGACPGTASAG